MIKSLFKISTLCYALLSLLLFSCDPPKPIETTPIYSGAGIFVVNEGVFNKGNASITHIDKATNNITLDLFLASNLDPQGNGIPLGDQAQSMTIFDNKAYIVVQNSSKIEVVGLPNAKRIKNQAIIGIQSPRYFLGISSNTGYISDWNTNSIQVVNLENYNITSSIAVGTGPDQMIMLGGKVYVINTGGYGSDNKISVIQTSSNTVVNTIVIGDSPNSIVVDKLGKIWVLNGGKKFYNADFSINVANSTLGSIQKINPDNGSVELTFTFDDKTKTAEDLCILNDNLYFNYNGKVYKQRINSASLAPVVVINRGFYGLSADVFAKQILGCFSPSFNSNGKVIRYKVGESLTPLDSFKVGIGPNSCVFY